MASAAKRFVKSSINWAAFAERVPADQKPNFQLFKSKVDGYMKRLMSYPEKPPTIDFASYRSRLPTPAIVDEFEKLYNSLKIPYPKDMLTIEVDAQEKLVDNMLKEMEELSDLRCNLYEKRLNWYKEMMPFDQMTMEDFFDYFPDSKYNVYKNPNFWPFDEPPRPVFPYLEKKEHH